MWSVLLLPMAIIVFYDPDYTFRKFSHILYCFFKIGFVKPEICSEVGFFALLRDSMFLSWFLLSGISMLYIFIEKYLSGGKLFKLALLFGFGFFCMQILNWIL